MQYCRVNNVVSINTDANVFWQVTVWLDFWMCFHKCEKQNRTTTTTNRQMLFSIYCLLHAYLSCTILYSVPSQLMWGIEGHHQCHAQKEVVYTFCFFVLLLVDGWPIPSFRCVIKIYMIFTLFVCFM